MTAPEELDLVVIGAGPAGEKGAEQAASFGERVCLIERGESGPASFRLDPRGLSAGDAEGYVKLVFAPDDPAARRDGGGRGRRASSCTWA